jgi:DNA processing protein
MPKPTTDIQKLNFNIPELETMKKYPQELFYIGNIELLHKRKISIVGTRKPTQYTKQYTYEIAQRLSKNNICIVSGGAMGVDALAHQGAGEHNTIMIAATGLDQRYPAVNKNLIQSIEQEGLLMSQFPPATPSQRYNFPIRNELVVALGEAVIVTQADENSGTMRSVEFALQQNKPIYVLPHRLGESLGTQQLLKTGQAQAIYNLDAFCAQFKPNTQTKVCNDIQDQFLEYCKTSPTYEEALKLYTQKVYEYELMGLIEIKEGYIVVT